MFPMYRFKRAEASEICQRVGPYSLRIGAYTKRKSLLYLYFETISGHGLSTHNFRSFLYASHYTLCIYIMRARAARAAHIKHSCMSNERYI